MKIRAIRVCLFVFGLLCTAGSPSCFANLNRKDSAKGSYGTGTEIFTNTPVPFTLSDGSTFTLESRIRCVTTAPDDCLHANSVFPYFYVVTVTGTLPVTQEFTIQLTAPFDPQNSAALNFGILDALDASGFGTMIAACPTPANPQAQNPCIDPVLDSSSNDDANGTLTFVVKPGALSTGQLQPGDQIFLYATSFSAPNCAFDFSKGLACSPSTSLTASISVSSPSGTPSPGSMMGLAPVLPIPGRRLLAPSEATYFDPSSPSPFTGNSITALATPQGGSGTTLTSFINSGVDLLSCPACSSSTPNVLYGYLYNLQLPSGTFPPLPGTITVTLAAPFNQNNFEFLNFGALGMDNGGTSSFVENCPNSTPATYNACVDAVVTAAVIQPTSLTFTISTANLSPGDNLTLFATSNNSPDVSSCNTTTRVCPSTTPITLAGDSSATLAIPSGDPTTVVGPGDPIPVPSLSSLSPSSAAQSSPAFVLTVVGTNFVEGAQVLWNGLERQTTFLSPIELTADILASDLQAGGTFPVTVSNPSNPSAGTSNGGTSSAIDFAVDNPTPTITSLSPMSATASGAQFTLTLNGSNFLNNSSVLFNGAAQITAFVSSTQLTATIPSSAILVGGTVNVAVSNPTPGGGTSGNLTFTIDNPAPTITSLAPTGATAGGAAFTLTVNGTGFVSSSVVKFNGNAKTTTFVSSSKLTAAILASDIATPGNANVTVTSPTPGGGTANFTFTIANASNPVPTLASISPTSGTAGGAAFTLTVTGTNFAASSVVNFNNAAKSTTVVSTTQLTAAITAADIATAGSLPVTVTTPAPGGGTTAAINFAVNNPVPAITSLSPASATAGGAAFTLTVNGSGFVAASQVTFNGSAKTPSVLSGTQLTIPITAANIATAGIFNVVVTNAAPGGGSSGNVPYTVNNPAPTISTISPTSVAAGAAGFTLTVNGTNFVSGATVNFNGTAKTTTFVSSTQLTAAITTADIANPGNPSITVTNPGPGGGTSTGITLTVTGPASFTMTATAATVATTPAASGTAASGTSTVTVTPSGGFSGPVGIACASLPGVTCSPTLTIPSGSTKGTLTVNVLDPSAQMTAMLAPATENQWANSVPPAHGDANGWWTLSAGTGFATLFVLFLPGRKRYRPAPGLIVICTVSFAMGCGGGGGIVNNQTPTLTATTTQLTVSATKVAANGSITVSATVMGGTPAGNVQFFVDGSALGSSTPVANGTTGNITVTAAQAPTFLQLVGTHTVSAHYLGDSSTLASNSGTLNVTVTGTTNLAVTGTSGNLSVGANVSLTIQ
jgi:hypothetical protein